MCIHNDGRRVFKHEVAQECARLLCSSAVSKIKSECSTRGIQPTRYRFIVLLMNRLLKKIIELLDESIRLQKLLQDVTDLPDVHRYVAFCCCRIPPVSFLTKLFQLYDKPEVVPDLVTEYYL